MNEQIPSVAAEELATRAQAGCEQSFEDLVHRFTPRVYNFLYQMLRNSHDAEDLTQETFVRAYGGIQRYDARYGFTTWLFTIAKRAAASHFRSARRATMEPIEEHHEPAVHSTPSSQLESKDETGSLWSLARTLKPVHYEVLWLRYGEGFSTEQTARVIGSTQIYTKVLLHRAKKALAELIVREKRDFQFPD